jgi:zinc transporter ZupT
MHSLFTLSCISLILGPICYRVLIRSQSLLKALDGFIFVTIGGLVFTHIIPELIYEEGILIILCVAFGVLGPTLGEKIFKRHSHMTHNLTIVLGVLGLILHTLTDGSALTITENSGNMLLAIGIIVHRFPEGLAVWWIVKPSLGTRWAVFCICFMLLGSTVGYLTGDAFLHALHIENNYLQAFVTGWILHVVFHQPHATHTGKTNPKLEFQTGLGALLGIGMLLVMFGVHHANEGVNLSDEHQHHTHMHNTHPESELSLLDQQHLSGSHQLLNWSLKLAPWLLGLYLLTILRQSRSLLKPAKNLYMGWFLRLLGPESIILTYMLLGTQIALYQLAATFALALWLGYQKVFRYTVPSISAVIKKQILWASVERSAPWVAFSLIITNLIGHPQGILEPPLYQAFFIACLLLPMRSCYIGTAILSITMAWSGWSIAAIMLPLIAAPIINIKQIQKMTLLQNATALGLVAGITTWIQYQGDLTIQITHAPIYIEWMSLGLLSLAFSYILLISGPRKFMKNLFCVEILHQHKHHH